MGFRFSPCSPCCSPPCNCFLCTTCVWFDEPVNGLTTDPLPVASVTVDDQGRVTDLKLDRTGIGYTVPHPGVYLTYQSGGSMVRATATANVAGIVSTVVTDGGAGYDPASPPQVTIVDQPDSGGDPATIQAFVDPQTRTVNRLQVTHKGAFYQSTNFPRLTIAAPPSGGRQATGYAVSAPGKITELILTNPGLNLYPDSPPVSFTCTITCPAWSVTMPLPKTGGVINADWIYPHSQGITTVGPYYCLYSGSTVMSTLPSGPCATLSNVPLTASFGLDLNNGTIDFSFFLHGLGQDPNSTGVCFPPPADPNNPLTPPTYWCLSNLPTARQVDAWLRPGGPSGPISAVFCTGRPIAYSGNFNCTVTTGDTGWYFAMGGQCPTENQFGTLNYTTIPFSVTITEDVP